MSSKPEAQNEPTMEEILASIRRIISEDEAPEGKPAVAAAAPEPQPASKPGPEPAAAEAPATAAPAAQPDGRGADNILDLTRMVAEDGSIVDLEAASEETPEESEPEAAAEEPEAEAPETEPEAAAEPAEAAAEPEPDPEPAEAAAEEPAPEPEPEPEAEPEPGAAAEEEAAPEEPAAEEPAAEDPAPEEPEVVDAADDAAEDEVEAAMAAATGEATGQELTAAGDDSEYVSAPTAAAATASLAAVTKAAMANRQGDAVAIGGGRTLEELVRQSLAPELKGWLDDNLPDLVERIVREEIRKMVRRAEDQ